MKRSSDRILTTHTGSLARPAALLELMQARAQGKPVDPNVYADGARAAVSDVVHKQAENGIDVVTDGEQSKAGFFVYATERLTGMEVVASDRDYRAGFKK